LKCDRNKPKPYGRILRALSMLSPLLLAIGLLSLGCWGARTAPITIQNDTNQKLAIYVKFNNNSYLVGDVQPKGEIENKNSKIQYFSRFLVEAHDSTGALVNSQEYTFDQMVERNWKIVISSTAGN
jgi:hypothetical protein